MSYVNMEASLALMNVLIMMILFSVVHGRDVTAYVAESSPRNVFVRKSYRYPSHNQMSQRRCMSCDEQQVLGNQLQTVDPHIDSLMRGNNHLINIIRRLELKFDRILDAAEFEENAMQDVMKKLNQIHQSMRDSSKNSFEKESPQDNLIRDLVAAVGYSNENINKLVTNFDTVMETGRRSMQSLEKVAEAVRDINERTIRIQDVSTHQSSCRTSNLNEEDVRNPLASTDFKYKSSENDFHKWNKKATTSSNEELQENKNLSSELEDQVGMGLPKNYESERSDSVMDRNKELVTTNHDSSGNVINNRKGQLNQIPITSSHQPSEHNNGVSGNGSRNITRKIITTTTIKTTKVKTQKTYRSLRKDMKLVTFEPDKQKCDDLTLKRNGIYKFVSMDEVANGGDRFFYERYCDFHTDDRAWTVIQRRFANYKQENFNRTWMDYKLGFGKLDGEFWFGNDFIHKLTFDDDVELRIIVEDKTGNRKWVDYSLFQMKSEMDNYKLVIGGYKDGVLEESFIYHNGQDFSTYDRPNGNDESCASSIGNGWWFKNCTDEGILGNWLGSTSTLMMIRPKIRPTN